MNNNVTVRTRASGAVRPALAALACVALLAACAEKKEVTVTASDSGASVPPQSEQNKPETESPARLEVHKRPALDGLRSANEPASARPTAGGQADSFAGLLDKKLAGPGSGIKAKQLADQEFGHVNAPADRERYENFETNPVRLAAEEPVSTFSADVDTASYTVMRRYVNNGTLPPGDAVRVEEFINYFSYDYALPGQKDLPFQPTIHLMPTPWNKGTQLLQIGIRGYDIPREERPPANLVLLLDVSGSMDSHDKLPLVKKSIRLLVEELDERDTISMVVYAGSAGTVLEPTPGHRKSRIFAALDRLQAGGSTAGAQGIELAYAQAQENFDPEKINRVILATDGDFNVGISDPEKLEDFIVRKRKSGIFLSVLGYGTGNTHDVLMQKLAQNGNGIAAYIDSLAEARKVLVDQMASSLFPIAKDVKIQVEFNPAQVAEYRLIGYETRALKREDFNNDRVDAGDIGAGHTVTALYEIVPAGSQARLTDPLRYGTADTPAAKDAGTEGELAFVKIRYKLPDGEKSRLITRPVLPEEAVNDLASAPADARFAAAVAAFGQYLRGGDHLNGFSREDILALAQDARGPDRMGYRSEFVQLVRAASRARDLASNR